MAIDHPSIRQRIDGYILALGEAFGQIDRRLLLLEEGQSEIEDGYAMAKRLIHSGLDFSAIFATTDPQAIGVLKALHEADIRVPEQVSVVGFDNIDWSQHTTPPLTTINIRRHALGQVAADYVIGLLSRPAPSPAALPHRITLPVELVHRARHSPAAGSPRHYRQGRWRPAGNHSALAHAREPWIVAPKYLACCRLWPKVAEGRVTKRQTVSRGLQAADTHHLIVRMQNEGSKKIK